MPGLFDHASYALRPFVALSLTTATVVLLFGIIVVARERGSRVSLHFFALTFSISVWLFAFSLMYATANPRIALFWAKAAFLGIPFIPTAAFHFIVGLEHVERKLHNLIRAMWALSAFFSLIILTTDQIVDGVEHYWWGFYPRYAWASGPYLLFFFFVLGAALWHSYNAYRAADSEVERRRMLWVSVALLVGYLAIFDYLPSFGIGVLPLGFLALSGFVVVMGHTVWRYELAEITASLAAPRLLETMHGNVIATDRDGKIRVISDAACSLLGYAEDDLLGKPATLISSDLQPNLPEGPREMVWVTRKGESVDVNISAAAVADPKGRHIGMLFHAEDISRRKREEALRESEARYRTLIESMNEGVILVDLNGVIQFANRRMAEMLGYLPKEIVGKPAVTFVEPHPRESDRAVLLRTLRRRELWVEISEAQQVDAHGKVIGTIRVHTDVSDRRRTELALRESEARYRLLAEYATDMISRHNPDGRILYASPAARSLLGFGPEELIGITPAEFVHPDDLPALNRLRSMSLVSKSPTTFTYRIRRKDGTYVWVETTWRPIREGTSESVSELVAVSRDITDRKRTEQQIEYQAYHDALTGLPNPSLLQDRFKIAHAHVRRQRTRGIDASAALLHVGIEHAGGTAANQIDWAMQVIAQRFREALRAEDTVTRHAASTFVILLPYIENALHAEIVATKLASAMAVPLTVGDRELYVTANIGVATCPADGEAFDDLLRSAQSMLRPVKMRSAMNDVRPQRS